MTAGRPRLCPDDTLLLVVQLVAAGWSYRAICETLNTAGEPTPSGRSRWYPS
ncbi:recombinase family protein [Dactylosporangium sp. NPDC051541]|uniref:recombinase family protein n=1 Tax=Dactylosporangium sp. NPDC051541 TaxID=3363977 RepID=UPI00378EE132